MDFQKNVKQLFSWESFLISTGHKPSTVNGSRKMKQLKLVYTLNKQTKDEKNPILHLNPELRRHLEFIKYRLRGNSFKKLCINIQFKLVKMPVQAGSLLFQSDRFTYEGARALGNPSVAGCNLNYI